MQNTLLVLGAGKDQELAIFRGLLPELQLLKPIAPVASTTEQTNHHEPGLVGCAAQVVIHLSGMLQLTQIESTDPLPPAEQS